MTGRFITAGLLTVSVGMLAIGGRNVVARGSCASPFSIALDPAIASWTSDVSTRQATVNANTSPPQAGWYSPSTSCAVYPYDPLNPQPSRGSWSDTASTLVPRANA